MLFLLVMYIIIVLGGSDAEVVHPRCHEIVNPDCPIRIIYDFLRKSLDISNDFEFDLCDEDGKLVFINGKEPWTPGLNCLAPKTTYFVVLFERSDGNKLVKPKLNVPEELRKNNHQVSDMMLKINKQLASSAVTKAAAETIKGK